MWYMRILLTIAQSLASHTTTRRITLDSNSLRTLLHNPNYHPFPLIASWMRPITRETIWSWMRSNPYLTNIEWLKSSIKLYYKNDFANDALGGHLPEEAFEAGHPRGRADAQGPFPCEGHPRGDVAAGSAAQEPRARPEAVHQAARAQEQIRAGGERTRKSRR